MKKNYKIFIFFLIICSIPLNGQSVNDKESFNLYVKLKQPYEVSALLQKNSIKSFNVTLEKQELISNNINGNVYKIVHQLNLKKLKELSALLENNNEVYYTNLLSKKPPLPPSDIAPTTSDFFPNQNYLGESPGINALYAWENGATGSGITIRNVEYGLDIGHEEFIDRQVKIADGMTISSEAGFIYTTHGTATAGVVYSDNGDYGVTGIAHNASEFILYPEWENDLPWDRIKAIARAVNDASSGDIIILEMQVSDLNGKLVMAEYDPLVWDLTKVASDKGVIVIAAAGNGGQNIDSDDYNDYNNRGNSGAIIVGATLSNTNHTTLNVSNYGTRIDVNAWGVNVYSSGYGDIQFGNDYHQYYTSNFLYTSSATAIIGGCVTLLQSYNFNLTGSYLNHIEMKELLNLTGTPQSNNDFPVGSFPNLKAAIQEIDRKATLSTENESNLALITFFPNPVKDVLQLKQLDISSKKIIIYNTIGKKMLETKIDKEINSIDISHLIKGVYFLKIIGNEHTLTKRIIKQ